MAVVQLAFLAFLVFFYGLKGTGWPWEMLLVLLGFGLLVWPKLQGVWAVRFLS